MKLLEVKGLKTYFYTDKGCAKAVDDISFSLEEGRVLGIVGESGCGKSVTSLSIMRLVDPSMGRYEGGEIRYRGMDLLKLSEKDMQKVRGNKISMIFQEPMTSLNPVLRIGYQIMEQLTLHLKMDKDAARTRALELLKLVGIPEAQQRMDEYPHQLSGGMRQRVMIAMALACNPEILIADEPTTALDVTIQAQIMELLQELRERLHMSIIIISHNLGVISELADEVIVMYAGQIVERAQTQTLFSAPSHPYTQGLIDSIPDIRDTGRRLKTIEGLVPSLYDMPLGCRFRDRCRFKDVCPALEDEKIALKALKSDHDVRCRRCIENA